MKDVVHHLIRLTTISEVELHAVYGAGQEEFVSIFRNMPELTYFSCDTWTPFSLCSLRILNEYADDCKDGAIQLNCPGLNTLVIDGARSRPRWNEKWGLLEATLTRYLKPLLRKRGAEYKEPLTVYLPSIQGLDSLGNVWGVRFAEKKRLAWKW